MRERKINKKAYLSTTLLTKTVDKKILIRCQANILKELT
jgi:hypothetical protein